VGDILDLGVEMELIEKRGSYYSYNEQRIAQGRENAKDYLRDNPEIAQEIDRLIRSAAGLFDDPKRDQELASSDDQLQAAFLEEEV